MSRGHERAWSRTELLGRVACALLVTLALVVAAVALPACSRGGEGSGGFVSAVVERVGGAAPDKDGSYTSKDDVAAYLHAYGRLPKNFISKTKARAKGWSPSKGNLDEVCPGMSIGGGQFKNDEGALPDARGRTWRECDVNYHGGPRGAERIVYSDDGLIFYTPDHYQTFEQLY